MSNIKLKRALLKSKKTLEAAQIKNAAALADVTAALNLLGADAPAKITRATKAAAADEEPAAKKAPAKKAAAKKVAAEKPAKAPAKKAAAEKPAAAPKSAKASGPKKLG